MPEAARPTTAPCVLKDCTLPSNHRGVHSWRYVDPTLPHDQMTELEREQAAELDDLDTKLGAALKAIGICEAQLAAQSAVVDAARLLYADMSLRGIWLPTSTTLQAALIAVAHHATPQAGEQEKP